MQKQSVREVDTFQCCSFCFARSAAIDLLLPVHCAIQASKLPSHPGQTLITRLHAQRETENSAVIYQLTVLLTTFATTLHYKKLCLISCHLERTNHTNRSPVDPLINPSHNIIKHLFSYRIVQQVMIPTTIPFNLLIFTQTPLIHPFSTTGTNKCILTTLT